eukprot:gene19631-26316_t
MSFLTVDNLKFLIGIIHSFFVEKYNINIETYAKAINIKEVIYNSMMSANRSTPQANVKDKNKLSLKLAKDALLAELNRARSTEHQVSVAVHDRSQTSQPSINVRSEYDKLMLMRTTKNAASVPAAPDFNETQENAINVEDFNKKLNEMQSNRDVVYESSNFADVQPNADAIPQDMYTMPRMINDAGQPSELDDVFNAKLLDDKTIEPLQGCTVEKYVIVNSVDRDFVAEPTKSRFKIRFTNLNKAPISIPFYKNNPSVPFTKFLTFPGMPNTKGFYHQNVFYPAYNAAQPLGEVLGYESVPQQERNGFSTSSFAGVTLFNIGRVVIPATLSYPTVLLKIEEVGSLYDGNSDSARRAFCTLVYESDFIAPNGRKFIVMTPAQRERKMFNPPREIDSLTITLTRPDGEQLDTG